MNLQEKLLAAFDVEHRTILERIRANLASLETKEGGDAGAQASLEEAFRMAHSLKGAARVVDYETVMNLAHRMETMFALVRQGKVEARADVISLVHRVLDEIEDCVAALKSGQPFTNRPELLTALEEVIAGKPISALAAVPAPAPAPAASVTPAASPAPVPVFDKVPSPSAPTAPAAPRAAPESLRVNAAHLDRMLQTAGALATTAMSSQHLTSTHRSLAKRLADIEREWTRTRLGSAKLMRQRDQDPDVARIISCFEFAERELKALLRETRSLKNRHERVGRELSQVASRLEGDIQNARLVPAESIFEGFHKMMRDLAAEAGKKIEFRMTGLNQEADRFVLQELKDPLMHLLRNTLAHGVESPADRTAAGKEPAGRVHVRLESTGNRLTLSLEDDGRGLVREKILGVALAQGILSPEQAARLKPEQVPALIFRPGFSTTPAADNLSGRGMGLSVVEETVKRLQGEIQVSSEEGKGCRFTLSVPIAIASHRVVLARSGAQSLAFPCHSLEGLLRIRRADLRTIDGSPAIFFRGEPVALASVAQLLGGADTRAERQHHLSVIVLRCNGKRLAILVDELFAERNAVIKKMPTPELATIPFFRGAVILEDGSVSLVVDVRGLVEKKGGAITFTEETESNDPVGLGGAAPKILVVDDSFTTRTLEKSILEANGYEVTLATDGLEALQKLLAGSYDLVISDVEMPRMDGFTLLAEIKKHPRLSSLPVIMVTSLEKNEDKQKGLDLGADAYLAKQKFDQGNLLNVVRQIL